MITSITKGAVLVPNHHIWKQMCCYQGQGTMGVDGTIKTPAEN